jgi:hypothetical protein
LFAFHKLQIRIYLAAIVIFVNEVKGKSALALSRDLNVQYKTAFVLGHKIREAMGSEIKGATIGGAGRGVEVDGCHVGGHVRPENEKKDRQDRRLAENRAGTRRVVVALRERGGRTLTMIFKTEAASIDFIRSRVDRATTIHADEAADWNALAKAGSIPSGSTTRSLSAWTAPAPTRRKACSAACAVPRSATIITCRAPILTAMRGRPRSGKTIVEPPMESSSTPSSDWSPGTAHRWIFAATGSAPERRDPGPRPAIAQSAPYTPHHRPVLIDDLVDQIASLARKGVVHQLADQAGGVQIGRIQAAPHHHSGSDLLARHGSWRDPQNVQHHPNQFALLEPAVAPTHGPGRYAIRLQFGRIEP